MTGHILLGGDDIKTLVRARDICAVHRHISVDAASATDYLLCVLRQVALDPAAEPVQ
jgi:hypothetical protein